MKTFLSKSRLAVAVVAAVLFQSLAWSQGVPTPGPEHEMLKKMEGDWSATIKSPEGESQGTMTYKMVCGGLWLMSDFRGDFGGMKFEGRGLDGYDPNKKKFVSVWVDSMSTKPVSFEGELDKEKKTLTMVGEGPGMDGNPAKFKSVANLKDENHHIFKMYLIGSDGNEMEMMTIEYTRKK